MQRLRRYTLYYTVHLISKQDPIRYLLEKPALMKNVAKWQVQLAEYDIEFIPRTAVKGQAIADHLAEFPVHEESTPNPNLPDDGVLQIEEAREGTPGWKMFFDGANNSVGCGVGAVLVSPKGQHFPVAAKITFPCTHNIAEYEACILGLEAALEQGIEELDVFGDSLLIISQTLGEWQTKDAKLQPYHEYLGKMSQKFKRVSFTHMPRVRNQFADALATLASLAVVGPANEVKPLEVRVAEDPAYCCALKGGESEPKTEEEGPWFEDIKLYLESGTFPDGLNSRERKLIRRMACNYCLSGKHLYRKSPQGALLRCVDIEEAKRLMDELHEGDCGPHMNGRMLAKRIMRLGYYWSTIEADCVMRVRMCHKCQVYADQVHVPPTPLHPLTSPWPFMMWGIDVIGSITPAASNGHRFILVAIDYFTKWIEAITLKSVTSKNFVKFLSNNIVARYGVPESIVTDNAANLNSELVGKFCAQYRIKHKNSTPYRPQANGAVEAANKNIKKILAKMTENYRDWHEKLPWALLAYRTSVRTSIGATPYSLVYGTEAVLPIEMEIPSARILAEADLEESEWARNRYEQLNLIDEKRLAAIFHGQCYRARMARAFDQRVRPRGFNVGDLVLRKVLKINQDPRGKFTPNYEGPYIVVSTGQKGMVYISTMDGDPISYAINIDALKKYYP